jgi:hypothetical protein
MVVMIVLVIPILPITLVSATNNEIEQKVEILTNPKVKLYILLVAVSVINLYEPVVSKTCVVCGNPLIKALNQNCYNNGPSCALIEHTINAIIIVCIIPNLKYTSNKPKPTAANKFVNIYYRFVEYSELAL